CVASTVPASPGFGGMASETVVAPPAFGSNQEIAAVGSTDAEHCGRPNGASETGNGVPFHSALSGAMTSSAIPGWVGSPVSCMVNVVPRPGSEPGAQSSNGIPALIAQPAPFRVHVAACGGRNSHVSFNKPTP